MTSTPRITIVIPTRDRLAALVETVGRLGTQTLSSDAYEIVVVDDGSATPIAPSTLLPTPCRVLRLEGRERSAARNEGARAARGAIVAFVDDDMAVEPTFLEAHVRAHAEWPGALVVGSIRLPDSAAATPFGRFRQALEAEGVPTARGPVPAQNLCTAANMSIDVRRFLELGGFDAEIVSGEDQDLALRHTARGGTIVFLPEALTIHRDTALDLRSYGRRVERGNEGVVAFCRRHRDWPDNAARDRVNGPIRWGREPLGSSIRKLQKQILGTPPLFGSLMAVVDVIERVAPASRLLDRLYRAVLGVCILRGYRRGLMRAATGPNETARTSVHAA